MNNNTVKITVTDNRGDLVLATTSETYAADLQNNKDKLIGGVSNRTYSICTGCCWTLPWLDNRHYL